MKRKAQAAKNGNVSACSLMIEAVSICLSGQHTSESSSNLQSFMNRMPKSAEAINSRRTTSRSAQSKKPVLQESQDLTLKELHELQEILNCDDIAPMSVEGILNSDPSFEDYGPLHEEAEAMLLHWCDSMRDWQSAESGPDGRTPSFKRIHEEIGRIFADMVLRKEVWFFRRLARFIQARREGQHVHSIPHADLDMTPGPGRKLKPYDLKLVGPEAIRSIADNRMFLRPWSMARISKEEIRNVIHEIQKYRGINTPKQIADSDLSRLITQMGIRKFMTKPSRKSKKL